ncbi:regulatory inactivation of DnaA Hda protein [Marinobacter salarius]|jgi:DnaA-homolog protein|uniref:DnaA regulatory inactivator Hda n=1 Tax=Marinobacter salarius TaxID=1420917 RepID=A0A1W6KB53_9GAMM|nr:MULTISPECIES: DnaA regulatory inactivator Hda [Marinobacter]ARM84653.1 DnaA regulatory inactivator Hda [Marinobacter salarius]KXJ47824.1 MAG: DnaA regulatory inactivator Hda [Marinobacter sp. Hex_13]MCZ4286708.1 DnaA regulatory inactivator Hda [Marinobacter salarius]MDC8457736.1 DnaA regulatory inactivator Hda [Marinobacter sp. DS40M6]MDM8180655.1 DnaA regulatory inactivator Hda [Marinobacter salarius]|tara:strand:+ start:1896 stop:2612 length:717 start_codon:yes stop_codon:yes gene_type:complete
MEGKEAVSASQLVLGVKLRDDARFDNFHGGRNADAAARLKSACEQVGVVPVIAVCGDADTGKSHLLQAVCHLAEQNQQSAVCVSMEELLPLGPDSLSGLEGQSVICLDDLDLIAGQENWEEAIFHLYNRVNDHGHLMVVSLSELPASLPFGLQDLVSRLSHGLTIQLGIYRDDDRLRILMARAEQRGLVLSDDVAVFILRRAPRKLADLLAILDRLDENSLRAQRRLTIPFVKSVLGW